MRTASVSWLWMLLLALPASAQVDEGFNAQNFRPPIDPFGYVTLNGTRALEPGEVFVAGYVDYSENALDLRDIREGQIQEMTFVHAVAAVGVAEFWDSGGLALGVVVPYAAHMDGVARDLGSADPSQAIPPRIELPDGRLGDVQAELKLTLADRTAPLGAALRGYVVFPTGEDKYFLSNDERFGAGGSLVLEKQMGRLRVGAELGYEWLEGSTVISTIPVSGPGDPRLRLLVIDDKVHVRAGIGYETALPDLWIVAEGHHWMRANRPYHTSRAAPLEVGGGLRYEGHVFAMIGASTRLTDGVGAPTGRVFASLGYRF